jgi:hypothetical protein
MGTIKGMLRWMLPAAVLALPVDASAQHAGVSTEEPFRKWDIGGGLNIRFGDNQDTVVPAGAWTADFGRYWTPHLKTSIAVMTTRQEGYGGPSVFDPRAFTTSYSEVITQPAGFGASVSWQFFDNDFVHPYVTAGARFASTSETTSVYSTRAPYGLLLTRSTPSRVEARPVIGGGFKSYFGNGRAFMRSELVMAIAPHGSANAVLTIGAGVDF